MSMPKVMPLVVDYGSRALRRLVLQQHPVISRTGRLVGFNLLDARSSPALAASPPSACHPRPSLRQFESLADMASATKSLVAGAPVALNLCRSALECSAKQQPMLLGAGRVGKRAIELSAVRSLSSGAFMSSRALNFQKRSFSLSTSIKATIQVGEKLPEAELSYLDQENNVQTVKISELTKGKKIVLFAVPGAFTPTCSQKHVPGFVDKSDELKSKGVDTIACVSVNDVFVMKAWGEGLGVGDKVLLLSDGNGHFTKALGVELDLSDKPVGLGVRSRRYALLADDGVVKQLNLEEGGAFSISGPDEILKAL